MCSSLGDGPGGACLAGAGGDAQGRRRGGLVSVKGAPLQRAVSGNADSGSRDNRRGGLSCGRGCGAGALAQPLTGGAVPSAGKRDDRGPRAQVRPPTTQTNQAQNFPSRQQDRVWLLLPNQGPWADRGLQAHGVPASFGVAAASPPPGSLGQHRGRHAVTREQLRVASAGPRGRGRGRGREGKAVLGGGGSARGRRQPLLPDFTERAGVEQPGAPADCA